MRQSTQTPVPPGVISSSAPQATKNEHSQSGPRDCHTEWSQPAREGKVWYGIPYTWTGKRNYTKELTYKIDLENETYGCWWGVGGGGGRDSEGAWDGHGYTVILKMNNQQGPTVQHRELCSVLCGSLDGRRVWGRMDTCVYGWAPSLFTGKDHSIVC